MNIKQAALPVLQRSATQLIYGDLGLSERAAKHSTHVVDL